MELLFIPMLPVPQENFRNSLLLLLLLLLPQQAPTYIIVHTYCKIKSHKKSYEIFDFKSRDSTFYKAIEKRRDVSSM